MKLIEFERKNVKIITPENGVFTGFVEDYIYPEDNENEKESIIICTQDNRYIEFYEEHIKTIKILQDEASNE